MSETWLTMSASDLGRRIGSGDIDPVALVEAYLDAIGAHSFGQRTYARLTPERARAEAEAAQKRAQAGQRLSVLDGVPISWKDLFDTAGTATEAGSALLKGRTPERDARVIRNATAHGLVCLGKTHMTELAFSGLGMNPITASPPCVNDHDAVSGGSSSGAATSVAFGLAAAGIGSDTGGSVRVPSAWNDLAGLRTTPGILSLEGVVPLCPRFDTVGPLCRTVEDIALLTAALEGSAAPDLRGSEIAGARLLVLETTAFDDIREEPSAGFTFALNRLAQAGARIDRAEVPVVAEAIALSGILFATEAYGTWKETIEANPEVMFPAVRERFRGGREFSGADYVAAWQALERYRSEYLRATAGYDAVLVPTCPIMPPNLARLEADPDFFVAENLMTLRNTRIANLMGIPSLTLPTGLPSTGISLMGPPLSERRLLRLGAAAESALT